LSRLIKLWSSCAVAGVFPCLATEPRSSGEEEFLMPVRVINRARSLITVPLNSGEALHLAPGETSRALEDVEVDHNAWVSELLHRRWIAVDSLGAKREARREAKAQD
jgi:hypothetical protein